MQSANFVEYNMAQINQPKTVLSSKNTSIISVAESLLKDAGITYSISKNGFTEIQVKGEDNYFDARKILMDLEELDFHDNK